MINSFPGAAVLLDAVGPHALQRNVFGTDATGTVDIANGVNMISTWEATAQQFRSFNADALNFLNNLEKFNAGDSVWLRLDAPPPWNGSSQSSIRRAVS